MENNEIKLSFDSEKMEALVFYLKKENTTVQKKMDEDAGPTAALRADGAGASAGV